jgi:hypothetical protein
VTPTNPAPFARSMVVIGVLILAVVAQGFYL